MGACTCIWASLLCIAICICAVRQHVFEGERKIAQQVNQRLPCETQTQRHRQIKVENTSIFDAFEAKCFSAGIPTEALLSRCLPDS